MSHKFLRWSTLTLLVCAAPGFSPARSHAQQHHTAKSTVSSGTLEGKKIFAARCAACHGLDGRGAERGPDIAKRAEIQHMSDEALLRIVREGVPGTGMPSFRSLGVSGIQSVVDHLRKLQGRGTAAALPGNPEHGKALFFGKATCSQCHMAHGEGGFIGSDLSSYASTQSADEIRTAITDPNKYLDPRKRPVVVVTADGKTYTGIARNEDNFTLQLQTMDGAFHSFTKSGLQNLEHQSQSLMPADYGSRLSHQELDDLVSYLMNIGQSSDKAKSARKDD
jgi:cytochrome c oxidase cbb3-type subunit 3